MATSKPAAKKATEEEKKDEAADQSNELTNQILLQLQSMNTKFDQINTRLDQVEQTQKQGSNIVPQQQLVSAVNESILVQHSRKQPVIEDLSDNPKFKGTVVRHN